MTSSGCLPWAGDRLLLAASLIAGSLFGWPLATRADAAALPPTQTAFVAVPVSSGTGRPGVKMLPLEAYRFVIDPKLNDDVVGEVQVTRAKQEDTMTDIARRFSVGYNEIHRANPGVDMWLPGAGRRVVVPTQFVLPDALHMGIVINAAEMRLYYFPPRAPGGKQIVYTFPIGIGRENWKTPSGMTTIVRKVTNPIWRPPADILAEHREEGDPLPAEIRPGPDDPMGNRALYLGWPEYAIHGTNKPAGVGMRVSHGCIHLYPEDIVQLYNMVPIGTQVRVVNQPFVFGWHQGELYMEAFGPLAGDPRDWKSATHELLEQAMGSQMLKELRARNEQVRWDLVMQLTQNPLGVPVAITDPSASLGQVLADARQVQNLLPDGAAWDGKTELPMDEKTFEQVLSKIGPAATVHGVTSPSVSARPRSTSGHPEPRLCERCEPAPGAET
jgi:L,D-transpeptidase ErfK/SrfK